MSANITNGKRFIPINQEKSKHKTQVNEFIITPDKMKNQEEYVNKYCTKGYSKKQNGKLERIKTWGNINGFMKVPHGYIANQNYEWNKERCRMKGIVGR